MQRVQYCAVTVAQSLKNCRRQTETGLALVPQSKDRSRAGSWLQIVYTVLAWLLMFN